MAKSDKTTVLARIQDVVRLLSAGAEFAEISQYASAHGWEVGDRQIRRYVNTAYKRLAKTARRNREELLGRHLMQRRALYARSVKDNDLRTALQVLRDEAALQGLYPPTKIAPTTPDGRYPYPGPGIAPLSRRERLVRLLGAKAREDHTELRLIRQITPSRSYRMDDTMMPLQMLYVLAQTYIIEQLEQAGMFLHAVWRGGVEKDPEGSWDLVAFASAYRFKTGQDAWTRFTTETGVDGDYLVRGNYQGTLLEICQLGICPLAPTIDEVRTTLAEIGQPIDDLQSAEFLAKSWHRTLAKVLGD